MSRERLPLLHQAILTLNDVSGEGAVSEEVGALRAAVDKAAEERDFEAASKLQKQLKLLEETQREEGNPQWADDTRNMARLGNKLNNQNLISMAQHRTPLRISVNGELNEWLNLKAKFKSSSKKKRPLLKWRN